MKKSSIVLASLIIGLTSTAFANSKDSKLTTLGTAFKTEKHTKTIDQSDVEIVYGGPDIDRRTHETATLAV